MAHPVTHMINFGQQYNKTFCLLQTSFIAQNFVTFASEFHPFDAEMLISIGSVGYFNYQVLTSWRREFVGAKKLQGETAMMSKPPPPQVLRMAKLQI